MKDNLKVKMKNVKLWDWVVWNQRFKWNITGYFMPSKKMFFFLCMYKMLQINKEVYEKCELEIIDKGRCFWLNRKDLEVGSDVANWAQIQKNPKNTDMN